ncbi:carboxylesterase/lipase family protein [Nocardia tenerifensis]|uniref:carboxylesterase/lipase family protein n=1 Tax=Nocardia tenerifensis TaxID=228006 RepID=UPI0002D5BA73|nr:carboxylesterase family protein [Nocardia tenerifensis]
MRTDLGVVRGTAFSDHLEYQGIPYAAPPVGELRWHSPQPHAGWSGVRTATEPGGRCAQFASASGTPASDSEDCLYLNVTTPVGAQGERLPVMVWLHGGGFVEGSGAEYDPRRLSARGRVVVVTVNYRLGIFGNFAYPGLTGSGAYGLEDQQAALRWVRRNAAAFGGDPDNVTLFGQSAGGESVCAQLASPGARGLFQRAVIQSSMCTTKIPANALAPGLPTTSPWENPASAAARGESVATELYCAGPAAVACLRSHATADLMPLFGTFAGLSYGSPTLPDDPSRVLAEGGAQPIPVLSGTTRDETTYLQALDPSSASTMTAERYHGYLADAFAADADAVAHRYPMRASEPPSRTWASVTTDSAFACPTLERDRRFAAHVPTYSYEFADASVPPVLPEPGYPLGAYHSADAYYLFDMRHGAIGPELNAQQRRLSDLMIDYWTNFARTGNPNGERLPAWPATEPGATVLPALTTSGEGVQLIDFDREHQCSFWAEVAALR